ncbi:duplicated carbonic anhydrase, putative [Eimeria acervulina]|uniref:Duplicated carbonic anhydrase, putative n=1 Tax=Eimeria acervulina TaxID=5801 RepID=U6GEX5_EIMAC|nr:duplicated carbonic anhydrase, putative [Eimeria acervulina]CDI77903.1 duplicated carbonic anhydrase, putative [Eimeria acervulina]
MTFLLLLFVFTYSILLLGAQAGKWNNQASSLLSPEHLSTLGAKAAALRANASQNETSKLRGETLSAHSLVQQWVQRQHQLSSAAGTIPQLGVSAESEWDYKEHGADWTQGKCKTGTRQSPVDLHIEGLEEPDQKNMTQLYLSAFSGERAASMPGKLWKKGDFFYTYPNQLSNVLLYRTDKVFQVRSAGEGLVPLGAMFGSDTTEMFVAHQILFHSPSEHTFQGEANRREIEMQIWHYSNDLLSMEASKSVNFASLPYLALFAQSSVNLPEVERSMAENSKSGKDPSLPSSHWRVISLTFMSEELDQASLEELRGLPSEKLLRTLLMADVSNKQKQGDSQLLELPHPLNLQSLMMMLQLTNQEFFAYDGSHTMPGCEENVRWYVARQPLPVATDTMLRFYKMLNPKTLKSVKEKDGNFRELQNVEGNMHNDGNVFLVQGFPLQVLIADSLGFTNMSDQAEVNASTFQGWFQESKAVPTHMCLSLVAVSVSLLAGLLL